MEERTLVDAHGVEVATRWWTPADPGGVVLLSHGASEHAGRYDRFAEALGQAGFAAVALDHRGQGRTARSTGVGVVGDGGGQALLDDLHELRAAATDELGALPTYLFGHSLGALIGLGYLARHAAGLDGAVLCGFPIPLAAVPSLGELLRAAGEGGLRDEPFDALSEHNTPFEPARTPFDWLSRDPDEVDRYLADPMCGEGNPLTYGYFIDLFDAIAPATEALDAISCPVLVIAGDHDPAAGMGAHPRALADALRAHDVAVDLTLYEGARHELLNETNRDEVTADVIGWLTAHR